MSKYRRFGAVVRRSALRRSRWLAAGLGPVVLGGLLVASLAKCSDGAGTQAPSAQAPAPQQLSGHLRPEIAMAPRVGRLDPAKSMTVVMGLTPPDRAALRALAEQVSDPTGPLHRRYLTPDQVGDQFGVSREAYRRALDWAAAKNLTAAAHPNRLTLQLTGKAADIETAFNVHLYEGLRADGSHFYAPDVEPSLDLDVAVEHVGNLENYELPRRASGSGPNGSRQGADFRHAYASCTTLTGAGQSIGIFMGDGFSQSDINAYFEASGLALPLAVVTVPPLTGTVPGEEGTLDIDMALSMAPQAQVIGFTGNSDQILTNMAARTDIKQFSSSWTTELSSTGETMLDELAVQGQSFFQASGDGGAYWYTSTPDPQRPGNFIVNGPQRTTDIREQPDVTVVGGTGLNMNGNGASYGSETAWGDSSGGLFSNAVPGRAGVPLPWYQQFQGGFANAANQASTTFRNAPDVSAEATDVNIIFTGAPLQLAGTSVATPLWAGFIALVNEQQATQGIGSVGFANPALYRIAKTAAYATSFNDITSGSNDSGPASFNAVSGYDLVTGLGSPQCGLIDELTNYVAFGAVNAAVTADGITHVRWVPEVQFVDKFRGSVDWMIQSTNGNHTTLSNVNTSLPNAFVSAVGSSLSDKVRICGHTATNDFGCSDWTAPADATKGFWFDVLIQDADNTGWGSPANGPSIHNGIGTVGWAQANRIAYSFCGSLGFTGGHLNGWQSSNTIGTVCYSDGSTYASTLGANIGASPWGFTDVNTVDWAQAARAADLLCFSGGGPCPAGSHGILNGNQSGPSPDVEMGLVCYGASTEWFDVPATDIPPLNLGDLGTAPQDVPDVVPWDTAARISDVWCSQHGFLSGRFNGYNSATTLGAVCVR